METAKLSNATLHYVDRGSGTPVLLVHGFPLDHTMWAAQIEALAGQARVIAPDLRGFGQSPLPAGDGERGVSMERYADDLVELLDALDVREPVVLVGFSMGGYIAWQFVRKYPQRLRALVPMDTRAGADTDEARAGRLKMATNIAEWGSVVVGEMMEPKLFAPASIKQLPEAMNAVRDVIGRTDPAAIAAAQRGMAERGDMTVLLQLIRVPTLVVVGEYDAISPPEEMQSLATAVSGAECVVIPDAGHMAPMENPDAVNEALVKLIAKLAP